ncbi:MAG: hypothetical protein K6G48_03760 [Acholeplasmatales bacterium]|nr:hypothetical protein [Acholeplasmatales bacterium]
MINLSRKLYISLLTLVLLFVVAGTVTFAWFKLNTNAWFSDMELGAETNEDLKISVDGVNYSSKLTNKQIASSMIAYANGWELVWSEADKIDKWYDAEEGTYVDVTDENVEDFMSSMSFKPVTTTNGTVFRTLNGTEMSINSKYYFRFDVYFMSVSGNPQDVYFSNRTITYEDGTVIPKTEFKTVGQDTMTFPDSILASFDTYDQSTGKIIHYNAGSDIATDYEGNDITTSFKDSFRTYISDAARFTLTTTSTNASGTETTSDVRLYELNKGNGSYATTMVESGSTSSNTTYVGTAGAAYDGNKNAALTYYNTVRQAELDAGTGTDSTIDAISYTDVPDTYKGLDTTEAAKIISLNADNNYGQTGTAKMTLTLWIEGWDADCIDTVLDQQLTFDMSFTNYDTFVENDPTTLTYLVTDPTTGAIIDNSKTRNQVYNMLISDDSPAYIENSTASFLGWARADENGNYIDADGNVTDSYTLFDFANTTVKPTVEGEVWYLVSVWQA